MRAGGRDESSKQRKTLSQNEGSAEKNRARWEIRPPLSPIALCFFFLVFTPSSLFSLSPFVDVEEERQSALSLSPSKNRTSAMFRNSYDTDVITWSPQGRLHQASLEREEKRAPAIQSNSSFSHSLSLIPKNSFSSNRSNTPWRP